MIKRFTVLECAILIGFLLFSSSVSITLVANTSFVKLVQLVSLPDYVEPGEIENVEIAFRRASDFAPQNPVLLRGLAISLVMQDCKSLQNDTWQYLGFPVGLMLINRGEYAQMERDYSTAIRCYTEATYFNESAAQGWHFLGLVYRDVGQNEDAVRAFDTAMNMGYEESIDPLAWLLYQSGDHAQSLETWERALDTFFETPNRIVWWRGLIATLRMSAQYDKAMLKTQQAIKEYPAEILFSIELGRIYYKDTGNAEEAVSMLKHVIQTDPNFSLTYAVIGDIFSDEKSFKEAYFWYDKALQYEPDRVTWLIARATMARQAGELIHSIELYQEVIHRFPESDLAYCQLAEAYRLVGDMGQSVAAIEKALDLTPALSIECYLRAGLIYEQAGYPGKALDMFQKSMEIEPENKQAQEGIQRLSREE